MAGPAEKWWEVWHRELAWERCLSARRAGRKARGPGSLPEPRNACLPQYEPRGVSCREAVNECDIAETCTGDSSQVRPARPPWGDGGGAVPIPMVWAQLG